MPKTHRVVGEDEGRVEQDGFGWSFFALSRLFSLISLKAPLFFMEVISGEEDNHHT